MSEPKSGEKVRKAPVRHQVDELEVMRKCDKMLAHLPAKERQRCVQWLFDRHNGAGYLAPSRLAEMQDDDVFGQ